jgi:ribosomal protein S18 acetylase RimI-like enzyme
MVGLLNMPFVFGLHKLAGPETVFSASRCLARIFRRIKLDCRRFSICDYRLGNLSCTIAETDGRIAGYMVLRSISPPKSENRSEDEPKSKAPAYIVVREMSCNVAQHILYIGVDREERRKGIGALLLEHEIAKGSVLVGEARASNTSSRKLFRSMGFVEVSQQGGFYKCPAETAIVMLRTPESR